VAQAPSEVGTGPRPPNPLEPKKVSNDPKDLRALDGKIASSGSICVTFLVTCHSANQVQNSLSLSFPGLVQRWF
jgi:hypothetical protein